MSQTIEVLVRVRPGSSSSNAGEITSNANPNNTNAVLVDEQAGKVCVPRLKNKGQAEFTFTKVFSPAANQQMVYSGMGDIVPHVLQGINCCCLTYGQTNTGKTYTMYGEGWDEINNAKESTKALIAAPNGKLLDITKGRDGDDNESVSSLNRDYDSDDDGSVVTIGNANQPVQQHNIESLGIVPRCIADLFEVLDSKCKSATGKTKFDYSVNFQILQIYNEKIFDLLHDKKRQNPLQIREGSSSDEQGIGGIHVRGLSVYRIDTKEDAYRLIKKAIRNKATRSTDFNNVSSRSHTVLQLFVSTEEDDADGMKLMRRSTLNLVDLAGSEKWRASLSVNGVADTDAQVKEMANINTSLHVLGNCISGLIDADRKHIPYRDSVLTRLLQSTLSGQGKTIFVATIHSDTDSYMEENYSTLQFASRASKIKVTLTANLSINEQVTLSEAQRQIKQLRQQLNEAKNISIIPSSLSSCGLCNNAMAKLAEFEQKIKSLSEENEALRQKVRQQDSYVTHIGANERSANKESIHSSFSQFGLSSDSQASYSENAAGIRISGKMKSMLDELDNISSAGGIGRTNYVSGLGNKQDSESVFHQNPTSSIAGLGNSNVNNNQIPMRKPVSTAPSRPTSSSAPSPKSIQNVAISTSIHDNVISVSNMQHNTYSNDVEDKKQGIAFNGSNLNTVSSLPNQFQPSQMANSSSNVAATIHYSSKSTIKPPNEGNAPSSLSGLNSGVDRTQISITQPAQSLLASKIQEMRSSKEVDSKFCKKHGLEDCVLCKMFGNEGNNSPVRTYGSTNYGESNFNRSNTHLEASASPFVTNTNWSQPRPNGNSYSSNSNATQFHSNASFQNVSALTSSGTYSASNSYASMNNITQESGNSQHRFQQLPIQTSYSSNPFGNEVQNDDEDDDDDNDDDNDIQIPSGGSLSKNLMALKLAADGSICQTHGLVDCLLCNMQSSHNKASSGGGMNKLGSSLNSSNGSITNSNMAMILPPLLSQDVGVMFSPLNMNGNHGGFVSTLDSAEMKQKQYGFGTTTSSTKSFVSSQVLQNQGAQMLNQSIKSNKVKEIKAISAIRSHQNQQMNTSPYIDSMASATYGDHMNNNNTYQYVPIGNQLHPRTSSSPLPFNHTNNIPPLIQNHDNDYLGNEDEDDDILEDHEFNFEDNGGTFYHDNADATNPSEKKKVKKKKKKVKKAATINTAAALAYLPASGNISHQQPPYGNSQVTSYLRPSSTQRPKNVNSNNLSNPVGTPSEAHKTPAKERKKVPKVIRQDA